MDCSLHHDRILGRIWYSVIKTQSSISPFLTDFLKKIGLVNLAKLNQNGDDTNVNKAII